VFKVFYFNPNAEYELESQSLSLPTASHMIKSVVNNSILQQNINNNITETASQMYLMCFPV